MRPDAILGAPAGPEVLGEAAWQIEPELVVAVLGILREAVDGIGRIQGVRAWFLGQDPKPHEPDLTRYLWRTMIDVRKDHHDLQCEFHHQREQAREVLGDRRGGARRLDITVKFAGQPLDEDEYLSLECKFLDAGDRRSHGSYVREGLRRYVDGTYAHGHDWACMVGLEKTGPLDASARILGESIRAAFGGATMVPLPGAPDLLTSRHAQASSGRDIQAVHCLVPLH